VSDPRDRVLVVDDAANLRDLLSILLDAEDDFEVVGTAADGAQAIEAARTLLPDIILLDLLMPGMEGM
jgi:chemotaxis response regulator CheB